MTQPTSIAAHESILPEKARMRDIIYQFVRNQPGHGATCDEVERWLDYPHQTASARITELVRSGRLVRTDRTRATRTGRKASVLVAKEVTI